MFTAEIRPPLTDPPVVDVLKSGNRYLCRTLEMNKYSLLTTYQLIAMTVNQAWSTSTSTRASNRSDNIVDIRDIVITSKPALRVYGSCRSENQNCSNRSSL